MTFILVITAGIGSIAATARLAHEGYQVAVVEKKRATRMVLQFHP